MVTPVEKVRNIVKFEKYRISPIIFLAQTLRANKIANISGVRDLVDNPD